MFGSANFRELIYNILHRVSRKKFIANLMTTPVESVYDIPLQDIKGNVSSLRQFKGKKILIVNVASECGYTPQYAQLQELHENRSSDIVVLGFPCNQFGSQEPGSEEQISAFCSRVYGVTFPMFNKVIVHGNGQHPLYRWLTDPARNGWNKHAPDWNFCKYLIDEEGKLTHFLSPAFSPFDERITG
jgi:glutathione peroxidase